MVIKIDVKDTSLFDMIEIEHDSNDKSNFWDMIHNAKDFAEKLREKVNNNFEHKCKEIIITGEKANFNISNIKSLSQNYLSIYDYATRELYQSKIVLDLLFVSSKQFPEPIMP